MPTFTVGRRYKQLIGLALIGLLATGCSASVTESASTLSSTLPEIHPTAPGESSQAKSGQSEPNPAAAQPNTSDQKHIERIAQLRLKVDDPTAAMAEVRQAVTEAGGSIALSSSGDVVNNFGAAESFVSPENSSMLHLDSTGLVGKMIIRVPSATTATLLEALRGSGKALSFTESSTDLTTQVVDVQARIAAQEASVTRLRELLAKSGDVGELAKVEGELARRVSDLEALKARQQTLNRRTSQSTIIVGFYGSTGREGAGQQTWSEHFVEAIKNAVSGSGAAITYGAAALVWLVLTFGGPVALLVLVVVLYRRKKARRKKRSELAAQEPATDATTEPAESS